jgi:serine/threonine protein kinase
MNSFSDSVMIGEGTYGKVYRCKLANSHQSSDTQWSECYRAVKRIKYHQDKDGFPITALREIQVLRLLNHQNIVRLEEILTERSQM